MSVTACCVELLMVTLLLSLRFAGATGGMESLVIVTDDDAALVLPAASTAFAVKAFAPSVNMTEMENDPLDDPFPTIVFPL